MATVSNSLETTLTSEAGCVGERVPREIPDDDDEPPPTSGELGEPPDSGRTGSRSHPASVPSRPPPRRHVPLLKVVPDGTALGPRFRTPSSAVTRAFRRAHYPDVSDGDWNDWHWQLRHRVRRLAELERILVLSADERAALTADGATLPLGITPYYLSLVAATDPSQPLRRTVVPSSAERLRSPGEAVDPLGEEGHTAVPGLVHRYPDRVLFLVHDFCTTYCRYCTRSRKVGHGELGSSRGNLMAAIEYIREHREVRDVLLSGGDPLSLADEKLGWILEQLRAIPHVELLRIGTKVPVVLPQRITPGLTRLLRRFHPLWMSVHFTHPDECTPEVSRACTRLADAGIPLGSQTVLLRGVNDDVSTMKRLMHELIKLRVRPYYLYQCDPIVGSAHFRTPVAKGLEIIAGLRGHTSGYAVPTYVIDAPGGGGKIPLLPDYVVGRDGDDLLLKNYEGNTYRYTDPG